jgi:hypothetical protein
MKTITTISLTMTRRKRRISLTDSTEKPWQHPHVLGLLRTEKALHG